MLRTMADKPIVFAMANPDPEIGYQEAVDARDDVIMATGRSDFPNQVNNVLAFPGLFRGALAAALERCGWAPAAHPAMLVLVSGVSFGLIHWSLGGHSVMVTGAIGAVFMVIYLASRSILPIALGHFAVNFVDFAGVVPKQWFQFLSA